MGDFEGGLGSSVCASAAPGGPEGAQGPEVPDLAAMVFAGMSWTMPSYVLAHRVTSSDVMAPSVTVRAAEGGKSGVRDMVSDARKLHLPSRRTTSAIPLAVSHKKRCKQLITERDAFLAMLKEEREEREAQEAFAATSIQAIFRGFAVRPRRAPPRRPRTPPDLAEELRRLTEKTEEWLKADKAAADVEPGAGWRPKEGKRAVSKAAKRRKRAEQHDASVKLQKAARGFLARAGFQVVLGLWIQERQLWGLEKVQAIWRGYTYRKEVHERRHVAMVKGALKIQCLARRMFARRRVEELRMKVFMMLREERAATLIQAWVRGRAGARIADARRQAIASMKLQALVRGHAVRRHQRERRRSERVLEHAEELYQARHAAIQKRLRDDQDRMYEIALERARRREAREQGAIQLQRIVRGRAARDSVNDYRIVRNTKAATTVQRHGRGFVARKRVSGIRTQRRQTSAAIKIQSHARRQRGAAEVERLRQERHRLMEKEAEEAAAERERSRREAEKTKNDAATNMQRTFRGFSSRRLVADERARRREALEAAADVEPVRRRRGPRGSRSRKSEAESKTEGK